MKVSTVAAALALASLGSSSAAQTQKPAGTGVLCMGTFIYFAEEQGRLCHAGQDPEYQLRLKGYVERIDNYIVRNTDGTGEWLTTFKDDENIQKGHPDLCNLGADSNFYGIFRDVDPADLDKDVDAMLVRDGKPTFGDCV